MINGRDKQVNFANKRFSGSGVRIYRGIRIKGYLISGTNLRSWRIGSIFRLNVHVKKFMRLMIPICPLILLTCTNAPFLLFL